MTRRSSSSRLGHMIIEAMHVLPAASPEYWGTEEAPHIEEESLPNDSPSVVALERREMKKESLPNDSPSVVALGRREIM